MSVTSHHPIIPTLLANAKLHNLTFLQQYWFALQLANTELGTLKPGDIQ